MAKKKWYYYSGGFTFQTPEVAKKAKLKLAKNPPKWLKERKGYYK